MALSIIGGFFSFGLAWANGANDTANSFGVVVGSKTLKIKTAIITCAICEFLGCVLTGSSVAKTISKGIVNSKLFDDNPRGPDMFAAMGLAVLIGTFSWTTLATWLKLPVSITHGVVGSLIASGLLALGPDAIVGGKVLLVCISWVTSPICGGIASAILWLITKNLCHNQDPQVSLDRIQKFIPLYFFVTFAILSFFIILKGPPEIKAVLKGNDLILVIFPLVVGLLGALIGKPLSGYFAQQNKSEKSAEPLARTTKSSSMVMEPSPAGSPKPNMSTEVQIHVPPSDGNTSHQTAGNTVDEANVTKADEGVVDDGEGERKEKKVEKIKAEVDDTDPHFETERYFLALMVISSCVVAFSHGGNDVANAIGMLGAILEIEASGKIATKPDIPIWLLLLGAAGFAIGILMWGSRVVETVGNGLTKLTVSRAYCAQLGAGIAIMAASSLKMPISTSHTICGSVIFMALADRSEVQWKLMRKIFGSWVITIPCAAVVSSVSFIIIDWIKLKLNPCV